MINVGVSGTFTEEKTYVIRTLFECFIAEEYNITVQDSPDTIFECGGATVTVKDRFFSRYGSREEYLRPESVPDKADWFVDGRFVTEPLPVIFGEGGIDISENGAVSRIDIIASVFFMLSRWEEYALGKEDRHERFPAEEAFAVKNGFIERPVVHEYAELLIRIFCELGVHLRRAERNYDVLITHDVDTPVKWDSFSTLKRIFKKYKFSRISLENTASYLLSRLSVRFDPYYTFGFLLKLAEQYRYRPLFLFLDGEYPPFEQKYTDKPFFRHLLRQISVAGARIGHHLSYDSATDYKTAEKNLESLKRLLPEAENFSRQHYLRFQVPHTWQILEELGIKYDSTMCYAEAAGFRCGICVPFRVFNCLTGAALELKEFPLILMDTTFAVYNQKTPAEIYETAKKLVDITEKHRGVFVYLLHNSSLNNYMYAHCRDILPKIAEYAASRRGGSV
jgi:hypothetical protein